jgi:hypothetical protein
VADAPARLSDELAERYVETWLNDGDPAAGGNAGGGGGPGGGNSFTVSLLSGSGGSGGDRVLVQTVGGQSWSLDEDLVEDVLDGDDSLPPALEALLVQEGVDTQMFAQQLMGLLDD